MNTEIKYKSIDCTSLLVYQYMLQYVYISRDLIYNLIFLGARVIIAARNDERGQDAVRRIKAEIGADAIGAKLIEFMKLDLSSFAEGIFLIN